MSEQQIIEVTEKAASEVLADQLDKQPTPEQVSAFINYLQIDVAQWLIDNAKSFVRGNY